ncbi:hypothetical protein [Dyadobacter psychrotolerans]|uniref:Uncharacterized protein n=1 Tax=Dyadobacter psychrotolerans TaxID=2541721 RepID=A0A4R5DC61_9BACT|nr:hypothetical protein [Dyadobacter psychrotolerans]TDE09590.1 hypothetical protein E0F88_30340 [Dyadobacter psychrotolerans]
MKSFILLAILFCLSTLCFGQILVGDVDINQVDSIKIAEVYVNRRAVKNVVHVYVDFGQRDNLNAKSVGNRIDDLLILDPETKRKMVFKSTGSVLNFFERKGWEYINGFAENTPDGSGYYYFRKRLSK